MGYETEAKQRYGCTAAWQEYEQNRAAATAAQQRAAAEETEQLMAAFAVCKQQGHTPGAPQAQTLVDRLQRHITENYYTCTDEILAGLGQTYVDDERFKKNIDRHAPGTAEFIASAIKIHCNR